MSYCLSATRSGPGIRECSCERLRVRWCAQCQQWICRLLFDLHECYQGTPLYGRERAIRRQESEQA